MANTKKSTKKITMAEFKAWLEGVEELQPEGWFPNAEQWKRIREKISTVAVTERAAPPPRQKDDGLRPYVPFQPPATQHQARSGLTPINGALIPPPPVPGGVPDDVPIINKTPVIPSNIPSSIVPNKAKGKVTSTFA